MSPVVVGSKSYTLEIRTYDQIIISNISGYIEISVFVELGIISSVKRKNSLSVSYLCLIIYNTNIAKNKRPCRFPQRGHNMWFQ